MSSYSMNNSTDTLLSTHWGHESAITLVDQAVHGTPSDVVSFLRDNMRNTKIYSSNEQLLYTVETERIADSWTRVYRADTKQLVAEVKRKDLRGDTIKFGDEQTMKLKSWLNGVNGKWQDL